ncbi:MAG: hypothetical protein C4586_09265 [Anaerolineaceae bacterium]|nr:MAG: hypothetical protein C4586_09265 [Anaerolineaceae bacterium]
MNFAKYIRVGKEGAQAGLRAKADRPPAIFGGREILRIGIAVDASAQAGEYSWFCFFFTHASLPR